MQEAETAVRPEPQPVPVQPAAPVYQGPAPEAHLLEGRGVLEIVPEASVSFVRPTIITWHRPTISMCRQRKFASMV